MNFMHPRAIVLVAATACLAAGFSATPFWDEDEPRFAAIAQTMLDTGDWVVPMYNDTLAVDKPVLMHWCMAACFTLFGTSEIAARLPAALATLATALALLRAGTRWFDPTAGVIAALAYVGCLLVGIESHAATPDSILTALTTWVTLLAAEVFLPDRVAGIPHPAGRSSILRAAIVGGLMGLAVLCKGPIGFIGPLAVLLPWAWWTLLERRITTTSTGPATVGGLIATAMTTVFDTIRSTRLMTMTAAMLAVAAPWYIVVGLRTAGAWPAGFFFIHNVGRFAAPMEKHGGSVLYHPLGMLIGFFPWSCFLPLAIAVTGWRLWKRRDEPAVAHTQTLVLFWLVVWVGAFSAAATKLPNYIMPAYPAAALLVGAQAAAAVSRGRWAHPGWMASGLGWLVFGGIATSATVVVATHFGLTGAEPTAVLGLVPVLGAAACLWYARRNQLEAIAAFAVTALVYTSLSVGPAGAWMARANALPVLVREAHRHAGGHARLGTFTQNTPNIVFYAHGHVEEWTRAQPEAAAQFLASGEDAVVIVPEHRFDDLADRMPAGCGIVGRARPLFQKHDFLLLGTTRPVAARNADAGSLTR